MYKWNLDIDCLALRLLGQVLICYISRRLKMASNKLLCHNYILDVIYIGEVPIPMHWRNANTSNQISFQKE